jgi:hypothetical protein
MGCTGNGMPKATPVKMFHNPEKTKVVESDIELLTARVIMSGSRVPRSPNDPEISDIGELRKVATLLAWRRRSCVKVIVDLGYLFAGDGDEDEDVDIDIAGY